MQALPRRNPLRLQGSQSVRGFSVQPISTRMVQALLETQSAEWDRRG